MKRCYLFMIAVLLLSLVTGQPVPAHAQASYPLENCRYGAFSTEEDFMMTRGEPYDGNPYISDGDLLGLNGLVCARNIDLLRSFDVTEDLGLDAVDIPSIERRIVAFSTELDSRHGNFTAGDLLITPHTVIPNAALVGKFQINYNIGPDGIQFIGEPQALLTFVQEASRIPREQWLRGILPELLARYKVDTIHFSTELLFIGKELSFTDGDVLKFGGLWRVRMPTWLRPLSQRLIFWVWMHSGPTIRLRGSRISRPCAVTTGSLPTLMAASSPPVALAPGCTGKTQP